MKTGLSLSALALELERQAASKRDFVASTRAMQMTDELQLALKGGGDFGVGDVAHDQLGTFAGIPAKYYDRMRADAPALLANNVNHWLSKSDTKRMVRTLDGRARGFLSDKFRPLENIDLAVAALPALQQLGVDVVSCEVTEKRLYIKAVDSRIRKDLKFGQAMGQGHDRFDTCSPVICLSNSEIGFGALSIECGVLTAGCTNLAWFSTRAMKKYHVGKKHELISDDLAHLLSDETRAATDKATWLQVGDVIRGAFDEAKFNASLDELRGLTTQPIEGDVVQAVEITGKTFGFNEGERSAVLRNLIQGGDLSRYGLFNAITRTGQDLPSYDRATEFERAGGKIIELAANDWQEIATAKAA